MDFTLKWDPLAVGVITTIGCLVQIIYDADVYDEVGQPYTSSTYTRAGCWWTAAVGIVGTLLCMAAQTYILTISAWLFSGVTILIYLVGTIIDATAYHSTINYDGCYMFADPNPLSSYCNKEFQVEVTCVCAVNPKTPDSTHYKCGYYYGAILENNCEYLQTTYKDKLYIAMTCDAVMLGVNALLGTYLFFSVVNHFNKNKLAAAPAAVGSDIALQQMQQQFHAAMAAQNSALVPPVEYQLSPAESHHPGSMSFMAMQPQPFTYPEPSAPQSYAIYSSTNHGVELVAHEVGPSSEIPMAEVVYLA